MLWCGAFIAPFWSRRDCFGGKRIGGPMDFLQARLCVFALKDWRKKNVMPWYFCAHLLYGDSSVGKYCMTHDTWLHDCMIFFWGMVGHANKSCHLECLWCKHPNLLIYPALRSPGHGHQRWRSWTNVVQLQIPVPRNSGGSCVPPSTCEGDQELWWYCGDRGGWYPIAGWKQQGGKYFKGAGCFMVFEEKRVDGIIAYKFPFCFQKSVWSDLPLGTVFGEVLSDLEFSLTGHRDFPGKYGIWRDEPKHGKVACICRWEAASSRNSRGWLGSVPLVIPLRDSRKM